ncbi:hypothetical protein EC912_102191 [Luteibacter rhizovicinus]|uniref:Uncharacterized protein n=1 Tax=Luteibacter rhizovicinus TaxID=242606 RepID=A0A4R3YTR5_9GAMM|nr:hypothetical protein [Luteibacter rhizovicinus]TCV95846.1 hypothetical protein EC912_102191 [Luteibacter rhizovicinus]
MSKDSKTRVVETLGFVKNYPGVAYNLRHVAADYGSTWIKGNFASKITFDAFSNGLSQRNNQNAGNDTDRKRRRACMLLSTVLCQPLVEKTGYLTLPAGNLDAKLRELIEKTYWAGDTSGTACFDLLHNGLLSDPVRWLNHNELLVSGNDSPGKIACHFSYDGGLNRFCIEPMTALRKQHGCYFEAIQIPAIAWHDSIVGASDHSQMTGVALGGNADIMITTQMTGCSLAYKLAGDGKVYAAHAYPDARNGDVSKRKTGRRLARELVGQKGATAADFSNAAGGAMEVYGPTGDGVDGYDHRTNKLYIVGVRRAGAWKIYGQHIATADRSIRVYRLYPTPVVRKP